MKSIKKWMRALLLGATYFASGLAPAQTSTGPTKAQVDALQAADTALDGRLDTVEGAVSGHTSSLALKAATDGSNITPSTFRNNLQVRPHREYMHGPNEGVVVLRSQLDRGEDGAAGFIGDSTYFDSVGLPFRFATALAGRYPTHRVLLYQAAADMQSITRTVVQAGPSGERYRLFNSSSSGPAVMTGSMARASLDGVATLRIEFRVQFASTALSSGYPNGTGGWTYITGIGGEGNGTRAVFNVNGKLYLTVQGGIGSGASDINTGIAVGTFTADTWYDFRIDFTANNGSTAEASFYRSTNGGASWSAIATNQTGTGGAITTTIPATYSYWIGKAGGAPGINGMKIARVQYYSGLTNPVLPERIDQFTAVGGSTTQTSILGGSPTIYIDQAAQVGATLKTGGFFTGSDAGDFPVEAYRCWIDHYPTFISVASSYNDTDMCATDWDAAMTTAVTNILARHARDPVIIHSTQPPYPGFGADDELANQHRRRMADIRIFAARNHRGCTDIYQAFVDANNPAHYIGSGNVHPTSAGYAFWGTTFWDCFLDGSNDQSANDKIIVFPGFMKRLPGEVEEQRLAA